jgi:VWFA-related protein
VPIPATPVTQATRNRPREHPTSAHSISRKARILSLRLSGLFSFLTLLALSVSITAQQKPAPKPTPPAEDDVPVKVFTEEVRLPVVAMDQYGHYDPSVVPDDILILEDGVAQQIRSVRHIPANVVIVLDTGGELSGLGGSSKRTSLTRDVATELINRLTPTTAIAAMQFNNSVTLLQPWTTDKAALVQVLRKKLSSGKRARFSEAVAAAAELLKDRPEGTRHVVFITDGVDSPGGKMDRAQAFKNLAATRSTVHIISYTELVRQKRADAEKIGTGQMPVSRDPISSNDPTMPPGTTRSPTFGVSVRFDPAMRRQRKAYEAEVKKSQQVLTSLADETGGQIFLPISNDQMITQAKEAAREIGSEYVVTYRPKRALAGSTPGEYRKIEVASRRVGLNLRSRRGYVVPAQNN